MLTITFHEDGGGHRSPFFYSVRPDPFGVSIRADHPRVLMSSTEARVLAGIIKAAGDLSDAGLIQLPRPP
jgi:hypothetical protein